MPDRANVAATFHRRQVDDARFGYTQGDGRWGSGPVEWWECEGVRAPFAVGDRDCASSVIDCWREALRGSAYEGALDAASCTSNMRAVFVGSGLFEWHPMGDGYIAQRGDVYLNESKHTAMCQSAVPDKLSEFLINEHGTITGGQVGDQTGRESLVRDYYDFPWDGILAYVGGDLSEAQPASPAGLEAGTYRVVADHLNVRDRASTSGAVVAGYDEGEPVVLDAWSTEADGYLWGRYTAWSGAVRYIAVGVVGGERYLVRA
ncbi:SH3 domain-containing protein [Gordonibacter urolithinfaciens]|uniref:SH3 domain-containing protein n=1 Tax=Gordonibacter urolithinfaciens TaxID=1335613 RepID=UPI001D06D384|nr:SH3 domain-containing protein [Gordonibacter urolithinfaciens]MCB7085269.1 SH3 domain-containing protein [Gordonibacter urolithinfaciens]